MTEKFLKDLYYQPNTGFQSLYKFFKTAKEEAGKEVVDDDTGENKKKYPDIHKSDIKLAQVKDFLEKQATNQINKQTTKPKVYNTILAHEPGSNYQMDIIVYDRYAIHKYKYILVLIDVYSRYAQARAMTSRKEDDIVKNFADMLIAMNKRYNRWLNRKNNKHMDVNINCDQEFDTKRMNSIFESLKIIPHFSETGQINKNAIVERFNRTIALLLQKWRIGTRSNNWPEVLPKLIDNYNNTYHTTINAKPIEVFKGEAKNTQKIHFVKSDLKVDDQVRIKVVKKVFDKGDAIKYSKDVYLITEIDGNKFKLVNKATGEEAPGTYRDYQLRKAEEVIYNDPQPDIIMIEGNKKMSAEEKQRKIDRAKAKLAKELHSDLHYWD